MVDANSRTYRLRWSEQVTREVEVSEGILAKLLRKPRVDLRQLDAAGLVCVELPASVYDELAEFDRYADYDCERSGLTIERTTGGNDR